MMGGQAGRNKTGGKEEVRTAGRQNWGRSGVVGSGRKRWGQRGCVKREGEERRL